MKITELLPLKLQAYLTQDFLNMEFAFKYGMWVSLRHSKSLKPRIWLQYKLDIPVCLKSKIFFSYRILTTYFRIFGFENPWVA